MARKILIITALVIAFGTVVVTPALAASSSASGYDPGGGHIQREISGSSLPFTGLDLAMVLALGVTLVIAGYGLSRLVKLNERRQ